MDEQGRSLAETVWTRLDRKAGAITELTIRQLRNRLSTWVVLGVSTLMLMTLLLMYVSAAREGWEPIDNDEDSHDYDGDGYPAGQERKYGASEWDPLSYPGSGHYVYSGSFSEGETTVHTGNHTWRSATGIFTYSWLDDSLSGNREILDVGNLDDCPNGEPLDDFWIDWGSGCVMDENRLFVFDSTFRGEGTLRQVDGWYAEWGDMTESYHVEPEPASNYIDEDDIDWSGDPNGINGFDDDGDCLRTDWINNEFWFDKDSNNNGRNCDVIWYTDIDGNIIYIHADDNVDEDPSEDKMVAEDAHRAFIISTGKIAFVMILSIFLPLFLALGLVRDETENGTLHYLLSKPIHRGEFITYRILGYLVISAGFVLIMTSIMGLATAATGPGDSFFRFSDLLVWFGIALATILALAAYGAIFNMLGLVSSRYGVYIALTVGVYEFVMAVMTLAGATLVPVISVSHWTLQLIDSIVLIVWPNTIELVVMSEAFGMPGILNAFWNPPMHHLGTENPFVSALLSIVVLTLIIALMIFLGQSQFKRREIM